VELFNDYLSSGKVSGFQVVPGFADVYPKVRVGGNPQPAVWAGCTANEGDPILVGVITRPDAPAQFIVLGKVGDGGPREGTVGTVVGGSATIPVTAAGKTYTATFLSSYAPVAGDTVRLLWQGSNVTALGKVGATPVPAPPPPVTPPPPPPPQTGQTSVVATDSGTYSVGYGWNSYYGQNVYQGNGSPWGGPSSNRGAWFYGSQASILNGATITRIQFRVPRRNAAGNSGSSQTMHIYCHTSSSKPGGDVSRPLGPTDVLVLPNFAGGFVDLPTSWAATLLAGGGIGIFGDPYMGFIGKGGDTASGQLIFDWKR
jgi:hypothetical protein